MSSPATVAPPDPAVFAAARRGDQAAFGRLIEPRRGELHAHCYRMLGSVHDAEDALQDAMLRAWKALERLDDPSAMRAWLYRIATNTCLDTIQRRPKRVIPIDYGPPSDPNEPPGTPLVESVWVEPYPDERMGIEDGPAAPEASYEQRESVELAFVAALQFLPARQRAALILREVLGFSAEEVAESLDTTVPSVNSALQRARATIDQKLPDRSQQKTVRALGDEKLAAIVDDYMDAMNRGDVDAVISMLTNDAAWSMPPLISWYSGLEEIAIFLRRGPLSPDWRWRRMSAQANGQPAVAAYTWVDKEGCYRPFALDVLELEGTSIRSVTAFIVRTPDLHDTEDMTRWPEEAVDPKQVESVFESFGLPTRLD